jgi:serine protease
VPTNTTPAQVINLSLGGGDCTDPLSPSMQNAVNAAIAAGSVVVAATGNEGEVGLTSPANCTGVIAVTAHTINGENADYANIGPPGGDLGMPGGVDAQPTISAPGGGHPIVLGAGGPTDDSSFYGYHIWSAILFGDTSPTSSDSSNPPRSGPAYTGVVGTSAATPQVAGVAALIKSMVPAATPTQIRNFLVNNVRPHPAGGACATGGGLVGQCGPGLLDANAAVRAAATMAPPIVLAQPQNATAFVGQTATFATEVTGAGPISYQWLRNGTAISGATAPSYTTPPLTIAADNGAAFSVVATNTLGTATTTTATLTVTTPPPAPANGGGGASPLWQVMLLFALGLAATIRRREAGQ